MEKNKMKSIALTLAVLFGAVSFAQANTQSPTEDKNEVVLEEVVAEENPSADATGTTGTNTPSETAEVK